MRSRNLVSQHAAINRQLPGASFLRSLKRSVGAALLGSSILLAGCETGEAPGLGQAGYVGGFFGGVASDEPNASLAAREVLTVGGSAADAAVSLAFALGVTMPGRAGLGAHGACLVHDANLGLTEALDFLPPQSPNVKPGSPAMPTFARGMAALHARYGRLAWGGLITPAEQLARLGHRASRATRNDLEEKWRRIAADPIARAALGTANGTVPDGITKWQQVELASVMGQIRFRGAGAMHSGTLLRAIHESYEALGAGFTLEEFQNYVPVWRRPLSVAAGNHRAYVLPPPFAGGVPLGQTLGLMLDTQGGSFADDPETSAAFLKTMVSGLVDREDWSKAADMTPEQQDALLEPERLAAVAANRRGPSQPIPGLPPIDSGSTGFVVVDREGLAVACTIGLVGGAGLGQMPRGLGFFPARQPPPDYWGGPLIIANDRTFQFHLAAAGDTGAAGMGALLSSTLRAFRDGVSLEAALKEPRLTFAPSVGVIVESGAPEAYGKGGASLGIPVRQTATLGRINMAYCPSGLPVEPEDRRCAAATDPRGDGLSALVN
ncbi:gamma-glutamyltransferase [Hwanghaeella sp.]|uniref:gamma-glutamyltransferase n=1 Tax=Hwanghaeella sp. TaxID=2605943 RepID=UPI003CCBE6B3